MGLDTYRVSIEIYGIFADFQGFHVYESQFVKPKGMVTIFADRDLARVLHLADRRVGCVL